MIAGDPRRYPAVILSTCFRRSKCWPGFGRSRPARYPDGTRTPSAVVIIPAHDEEASIGGTVAALRAEASTGVADLLVVADNCTDRTADLARAERSAKCWFAPTRTRAARASRSPFARDELRQGDRRQW